MPDRVLHDGLQQETGHIGLERIGRDHELDGQAVAEANALDLQIFFNEGELIAELGEGLAGVGAW